MSTFECVFTNSQRPVVGCGGTLTIAAGILDSQRGFERNRRGSAICKNAFKNAGVILFL